MIEFGSSIIFISGLMVVGAWLERINGIHGLIDEFLTPWPLGVAGMLIVFERTLA